MSDYIPKYFQLTTTPWSPGSYAYNLRSLEPDAEKQAPYRERLSAWAPKGQDKVWVSWSSGYGGFRGTLTKARNGDLAGKIKEHCDSRCEWKRSTGDLRVHKVACDPTGLSK